METKSPDPGRGRREGRRSPIFVGSLGLGGAKRCWQAVPLPLMPLHCAPSTPQRSQQFSCPQVDPDTHRRPWVMLEKHLSAPGLAGQGSREGPESHSIMQIETPRLKCQENKLVHVHQGPGRGPRHPESPPGPLPHLQGAEQSSKTPNTKLDAPELHSALPGGPTPPGAPSPGEADGAEPAENGLSRSPAVAQM